MVTLARARMVGPWAVLGYAMANAIATVPHTITLPAIVGSRASLNLFVAIVGPSGDGKDAAAGATAEGLKFAADVPAVPLGTGEGIARTFRPHGTEPGEVNPVDAAVFVAPEIDTVSALASRQGSTLSAELRKLYGAGQIGFANANKETRNIVAAGSYRACLTVGVQPLRSHALLAASDGGLPQRFVWLPAADVDSPDVEPADPGAWEVDRPAWGRAGTMDLVVPDVARVAIRRHRKAVLRREPDVDPLDGHALLTRLKVAAALMALDGRTVVSDEDWSLAGYVMSLSNRSREACLRELSAADRRANKARALAAADRDEIVAERKQQRAKESIMRRLERNGGAPIQQREIRRGLRSDVRDYFDPAANELLAQNLIAAGHDGKAPTFVASTWTEPSTPPEQHESNVDAIVHVDTDEPKRWDGAAGDYLQRASRSNGASETSGQ